MTAYRRRELGDAVRSALAEMPVVVVTGLRQTGKSTFLQHEPGLAGRRYLSLDELALLDAARRDPEAFVRSEEPLIIDEVQRCPELLTAIKREVDRDRRAGRFLLSGSANFTLLSGITESLAGRALYLTLWPFTRREMRGDLKPGLFLRDFFETGRLPRKITDPPIEDGEVLRGGMPPVCLGQVQDAGLWFKGYEQTYLERDVRELARVADLVSFRQLLRLAALRTGQILKVSELARDAKLNAVTAARHLGVMEVSFVFHRLEPYLGNRASRLIKSPKLYVGDSGIAGHLCGVVENTLERDEPLRGPLLETYVVQNLRSMLEARWRSARLSFWHVQGRHEVDFVVEVGRECLAIELKSSARWTDRDLAGLLTFLDRTPRCRAGILAHGGNAAVQLGERLYAIPLATVLS
ncbi:MAG: ATP-binding protein [Candidatus Rokubacteria bacterium]|nr:ATP-binding protein [Candidatus Rokubacteria bacterium]